MTFKRGLLILGGGKLASALTSVAISYQILPVVLAEREDISDLVKQIDFITGEDRVLISYRGREFRFALERAEHELRKRGLGLRTVVFLEQVILPLHLESILELGEEKLEEELNQAFLWALESFKKLLTVVRKLERGGVLLSLISLAGDYPMEYQAGISLASSALKTMLKALKVDPLVRDKGVRILMAYPGLADPSLRRTAFRLDEKELMRIASFILENALSPPQDERKIPVPFGILKIVQ